MWKRGLRISRMSFPSAGPSLSIVKKELAEALENLSNLNLSRFLGAIARFERRGRIPYSKIDSSVDDSK